jgi:hypothetical protein
VLVDDIEWRAGFVHNDSKWINIENTSKSNQNDHELHTDHRRLEKLADRITKPKFNQSKLITFDS